MGTTTFLYILSFYGYPIFGFTSYRPLFAYPASWLPIYPNLYICRQLFGRLMLSFFSHSFLVLFLGRWRNTWERQKPPLGGMEHLDIGNMGTSAFYWDGWTNGWI
jgi:hypothetical protein